MTMMPNKQAIFKMLIRSAKRKSKLLKQERQSNKCITQAFFGQCFNRLTVYPNACKNT